MMTVYFNRFKIVVSAISFTFLSLSNGLRHVTLLPPLCVRSIISR